MSISTQLIKVKNTQMKNYLSPQKIGIQVTYTHKKLLITQYFFNKKILQKIYYQEEYSLQTSY